MPTDNFSDNEIRKMFKVLATHRKYSNNYYYESGGEHFAYFVRVCLLRSPAHAKNQLLDIRPHLQERKSVVLIISGVARGGQVGQVPPGAKG